MNEMEDETGQTASPLKAARIGQITEVDGLLVETHTSKKASAANNSAYGKRKSQISGQDSTSDEAGSP